MQDSSNFNFPCVDGFLKYVVTLFKEGWTRHQENAAKPPLTERTGWLLTSHSEPARSI